MTSNGYVSIDKLKVGDKALTYNETTGKNEFNKILAVYKFDNSNEDLYTLTFDDNTSLKVTSLHRFYIKRRNTNMWLQAERIVKGDSVRYSDGTYHKVKKISHKDLRGTVYNLNVDNTHNFYVGKQQILVHNVLCDITKNCNANK